jgi:ribonuclease HIII
MAVVRRSEREKLKGETIAAQDQALQTKSHATKILQTETHSKRTLCQKFDEMIEHIIAACPILAKEQYVKRQDRLRAHLHFKHTQGNGSKIRQGTLV